MFPLEFPLRVLRRHKSARVVVDPFCGRGTTLFAARALGLRAVGIDASPVAVAISQAKLSQATTRDTVALARRLIQRTATPTIPQGEFWRRAFHEDTLRDICSLRESFLRLKQHTDEVALLRAAILGILHGPTTRVRSYLSNQMPRTFAPKPAYAVAFWKARGLRAPGVSLLTALERKLCLLETSIDELQPADFTDVIRGDSSLAATYRRAPRHIDVVVTSPPYYGMRTYVADQWLRQWFLGGPSTIDYSPHDVLPNSSPADFAEALGRTWKRLALRARDQLHLHVRFGAIPSRAVDARNLLLESLESSAINWEIISLRGAQNADAGKRQVRHMRDHGAALDELDLHATAA